MVAEAPIKAGAIRFSLKGDFIKMKKKMSIKEFSKAWMKILKDSLEGAAQVAEKDVRVRILDGKTRANAELTKILKGSETPLVETGVLAKALTHDVFVTKKKKKALVGWKKGGPIYRRSRLTIANVAAEMHKEQGQLWSITDAHRKRLFKYWAWKLSQHGLKFTGAASWLIYVPRRAPLADAAKSRTTQRNVKKIFVQRTQKGMARYLA